MAHASDEIQEDDEAVRCICGFDDYPGPPPIDHDTKHGKVGQDAGVFAGIELTDEITGFFVQCDVCKVWQHGACVGIMTEESSPEEYFCEQCRKDFHRIHKASNGLVFGILDSFSIAVASPASTWLETICRGLLDFNRHN